MSRLRLCIAVLATALAVLCSVTPLHAFGLLFEAGIIPPLAVAVLCGFFAWGFGLPSRAAVALACALLSIGWVGSSVFSHYVLDNWLVDTRSLLEVVHAAAHERVWLTAAGLAVVLFAACGDEQTQQGSATFRRPQRAP